MSENEPATRLNIFDLIALLAKWRKLFLVNFLLVTIIAAIISLLLPVWYQATTVILPPASGSSGVPSFLPSELVSVAMNFGLETPSEEIYQTILDSRTLKERMIDRFNLREKYEMREDAYMDDVIEVFFNRLNVETSENQSIAVTVLDQDPEFCATLANGCIEELDRLLRDISSENAARNSKFIGRRLKQVEDSLSALQDSIMRFQQSTKAISISDQMSAMIDVTAKLEAERLANEIQIEVMRSSFGSDHPAISQLLITNRELEQKQNQILGEGDERLFIGMRQMPEINRQYGYLIRRIRIQSTLLEYVYPQYENARIQEQRETANIQVLDYARVPDRKCKPQRKLIVLTSAVVSLIVTLVIVMFVEYWKSLPEQNRHDWEKVQGIINTIRRRR